MKKISTNIILCFLLFIFINPIQAAEMRPISEDAERIIKKSAKTCIEAAKHTMNIDLKYDENSIRKIDDIISKAWPDGPSISPEKNATRYQLWGCFLGEAMRHSLGARWVITDNGYGIAVGNIVAHPINKIEKRFINGMDDSVTFFYETFKKMPIDKN